MKILVPIAGESTRFKGMRPKWMLTFPNGEIMIERSIIGLNVENVNEIVFIALKSQIDSYDISLDFFRKSISEKIKKDIPINFEILGEPTNSQPTTIYRYLIKKKEDFPFFVKDCDNYFNYQPEVSNSVAYIPLESLDNIANPGSKSYLRFDKFGEIQQIAEKEIISSNFCCGGYGFNSSKEFIETYKQLDGENQNNLYLSHIIHKQILQGKIFNAKEAQNYEDYGTSKEYFEYTNQSSTIFCDFDGVLVTNSSKFSKSPWTYEPISENLKALKDFLSKSNFSKLVITTSRPNLETIKIKKFLEKFEIVCDNIVTDLPHAKRILINDFSKTNPFPSANAINIERNNKNLKDLLK